MPQKVAREICEALSPMPDDRVFYHWGSWWVYCSWRTRAALSLPQVCASVGERELR
jgi:hypothetical protein